MFDKYATSWTSCIASLKIIISNQLASISKKIYILKLNVLVLCLDSHWKRLSCEFCRQWWKVNFMWRLKTLFFFEKSYHWSQGKTQELLWRLCIMDFNGQKMSEFHYGCISTGDEKSGCSLEVISPNFRWSPCPWNDGWRIK